MLSRGAHLTRTERTRDANSVDRVFGWHTSGFGSRSESAVSGVQNGKEERLRREVSRAMFRQYTWEKYNGYRR